MKTHPCPFCGQLVKEDDLYCGQCGGPQSYENKDAQRLVLDPWLITHEEAKKRFKEDEKAMRALVNTWRLDPDPSHTVQIQEEIEQALAEKSLTIHGWYFCCPWSAIYTADREVTIDGRTIVAGQEFTYDVSARGMEKGKPFKRRILVGTFAGTQMIDYCLPGEEETHNHYDD